MVSVAWLMSVYYNVIIAHVLLFLFASLAAIPTQLPWISCDNWWNTPNCIGPTYISENVGEITAGGLGLNATLNSTSTSTTVGYGVGLDTAAMLNVTAG